jgi:hypothetical protein
MLDEMKMELSLHPDARFIYADADNSSKKQIEQVTNAGRRHRPAYDIAERSAALNRHCRAGI